MESRCNIDDDVLEEAKSLAAARKVSVGVALSELARRGVAVRTPVRLRNGFPVFVIPPGTKTFGPDDVAEAFADEDLEKARQFLVPGR